MPYLVRFKWWVTLFVSPFILLLSLLASKRHLTWSRGDNWGLILSGGTIGISFFGIIVAIMQQRFESTKKIESILIFCAVGLWGISSTISNLVPAYRQEFNDNDPTDIVLPNVYFFSYICVAVSVVLLASWFEQYIQNEDAIATTSWVLLGASSFFVMMAAVGIRDIRIEDVVNGPNGTSTSIPSYYSTSQDDDVNVTLPTFLNESINITGDGNSTGAPYTSRTSICAVTETISCARVDIAIILGAVSSTCAWVTAPWKNAPPGCMAEVSFLLLIAWACAVGFLTFGTGPGQRMGTIYFGTWCCVFLCLDILTSALAQLSQRERRRLEQQDGGVSDSSQPPAPTTTASSQRIPSVRRNSFLEVAYGHLERQGRRLSAGPSVETERGSSASVFSSVGAWRGESIRDLERRHVSLEASDVDTPVELSNFKTPVERHRFRRLQLWMALLIASVVCLAAYFPLLPEPGSRSPIQKLGLAVPSFSIAISCCGYIACVRNKPKARTAELVWIFFSIASWAAGLPTIFYVEYDYVSSNGDGTIETAASNANVFFSTWCGFVISLLLATRWFRTSITHGDWVLLWAFSVCLFVSSLLFYRKETSIPGTEGGEVTNVPTCSVLEEYSCSRVLFGICLGLVSAGISLSMVAWNKAPIVIHATSGILLFGAWCCAVGCLTYGSGHGVAAGSVYLESWAGLYLSLDVTTTNIVLLLQMHPSESDEPSESADCPEGEAMDDEEEATEEDIKEGESDVKEEDPPEVGACDESKQQPLKED